MLPYICIGSPVLTCDMLKTQRMWYLRNLLVWSSPYGCKPSTVNHVFLAVLQSCLMILFAACDSKKQRTEYNGIPQLVSFGCSRLIRSVNNNCKGIPALILYVGYSFLRTWCIMTFWCEGFWHLQSFLCCPSGFVAFDCSFRVYGVSVHSGQNW